MNHKLPRSFYVISLLGLLLLWATHVISVQQAALDARPLVEDFKTDARAEDVRRDPVTVKRHSETTRPDGTKSVVDSERVIGAVESHTENKSESSHKETPIAAPRARTRYVGLGIDPLRYAAFPRLRAGVTVFGALDLGVAYDARFSPTSGAFGLEAAYRF